jgi:multidrug efflux pump subunit AcrA (membrane-fusion protein)
LAARAKAQADLEKLERAKRRNQDLLPAGAISQGADQDTASSVEAAHAALDSAIYDEASAVLRAPFDGVVLARRAEIGEMLAPGQQALTLAAVGSPWLARAAIPAAVARTLRPGQMATLMLRQGTQSTQVRVRHIGALADPHTGSVQVDFVGAQGLAPTSGELGSIQVIAPDTRAQPDAQRLPPEALLDVHGTTGHVFAIDRTTGSAHLLTVEVLGIDEEDLLVRGIAPDTKIITSGAGFASEGKKVLEIAP